MFCATNQIRGIMLISMVPWYTVDLPGVLGNAASAQAPVSL